MPNISIPGIGPITVRVYLVGITPAGVGVFFSLTTAQNLANLGTAAGAAIAAAIIGANKNLTPFAVIIGTAIGNALNSIPNYVKNVCGAQGGGFTINFLAPDPVAYCGGLPAWPL